MCTYVWYKNLCACEFMHAAPFKFNIQPHRLMKSEGNSQNVLQITHKKPKRPYTFS